MASVKRKNSLNDEKETDSKMKSTVMKIKLLEPFETRFGRNGKYHQTYCLSDQEVIVRLIVPDSRIDEFNMNGFYKLSKMSFHNEIITFNRNTEVTTIKPFQYNQKCVDLFLSPKIYTIYEALNENINKRVSIEGIVKEVHEAVITDTWQRTDVTLSDLAGYSIDVKLWNEKSCMELHKNDCVKFLNVEITEYLGRKQIQSTSMTKLEIVDEEQVTILEDVEADEISFSKSSPAIIIDDKRYGCNLELLLNIFPDRRLEKFKLNATVKSSKIVHLTRFVNKPKDNKTKDNQTKEKQKIK